MNHLAKDIVATDRADEKSVPAFRSSLTSVNPKAAKAEDEEKAAELERERALARKRWQNERERGKLRQLAADKLAWKKAKEAKHANAAQGSVVGRHRRSRRSPTDKKHHAPTGLSLSVSRSASPSRQSRSPSRGDTTGAEVVAATPYTSAITGAGRTGLVPCGAASRV